MCIKSLNMNVQQLKRWFWIELEHGFHKTIITIYIWNMIINIWNITQIIISTHPAPYHTLTKKICGFATITCQQFIPTFARRLHLPPKRSESGVVRSLSLDPSTYGCFQKIGVPQRWFRMENPIQNGWFGGTTIFGNTHIDSQEVSISAIPGIAWQTWKEHSHISTSSTTRCVSLEIDSVTVGLEQAKPFWKLLKTHQVFHWTNKCQLFLGDDFSYCQTNKWTSMVDFGESCDLLDHSSNAYLFHLFHWYKLI